MAGQMTPQSESEFERSFSRVTYSVTHAKIRRAVEGSIDYLTVKEIADVANFIVYRAYLAARSRAIDRNNPVPTFEEFLLSFFKSKSSNPEEVKEE